MLNHKGAHLSVRGPLNIARPVQGWPVIVQAGASEAGRQLAAETAEVVFAAGSRLADGQAFYADVKGRMDELGRDPRSSEDPAGRFRRRRRHGRRGARKAGAARQPRPLRQRASPRCRSRSAMTLRASIPTGRCPKSRRPTPARAAASASSRWRSARISPSASSRSGSAAIPASPSSARRTTIAD